MFKELLENVKKNQPIVHNITNYVTVNDCANILLACGGSPIMSDDIEEVEEITSICNALNINIGTLNQRTIPAMLSAGKKALELHHPIVLDPVGAGASVLRTQTALTILRDTKPTVVRGNISEIKTLATGSGTTKGVDADIADKVTLNTLENAVAFAKEFSKKTGAIIAITGEIDIVANKDRAYCIFNGNAMMSSITGTGCQLSSLIGAFLGANSDNTLAATAAAVCAMGVCGEIAHKRLTKTDGNASYRNYIIDAMYNLNGEDLDNNAKYKLM